MMAMVAPDKGMAMGIPVANHLLGFETPTF
jgi:hypothetical protein